MEKTLIMKLQKLRLRSIHFIFNTKYCLKMKLMSLKFLFMKDFTILSSQVKIRSDFWYDMEVNQFF